MENTTDTGVSPAQETGVEEISGGLAGDQVFRKFLEQEAAQVEEAAPEVEEVVEDQVEEPEPEPEVPEQESTEEEVSDQQPEEDEAEEEEADPEEESSLQDEEKEQRVPLKRLNKEVARRKALEERLEKARARVAELESAPPAPPPQPSGDALQDVLDPAALAKLEADTRMLVDQLEEKLIDDPDTVDDDGNQAYKIGGELWTRRDLARIARKNRQKLERDIPQKRQYFQQTAQVEAQARQQFQWLNDTTSEEYQTFRGMDVNIPQLRGYPGKTSLLALAIEGMKAIHARQQPQVKKAAKKETPPPVSRSESAPRTRVKDTASERRRARVASESKTFSKGNLSSADVTNVFLKRITEGE